MNIGCQLLSADESPAQAWMVFCDHQNDFVVDTNLKRAAFGP